MKKIIALSLILSTAAAFAEDAVYGAFVLNSDKAEVVLCVPWVNPGSADGAIKVTDLLDKSTLAAGDEIHYYDLTEKGYISWRLKQLDASKVWECGTPGAEETALVRGNAIILKRDMTNRSDTRIIINGQVGTNPAGAMTMARVSKEQESKKELLAYTLIAPASPDNATSLNAGTWTGVKENDAIYLDGAAYSYNLKDEKWGTKSYEYDSEKKEFGYKWTYPETDPAIAAGQGAWFVAQGEASTDTKWDPAATQSK